MNVSDRKRKIASLNFGSNDLLKLFSQLVKAEQNLFDKSEIKLTSTKNAKSDEKLGDSFENSSLALNKSIEDLKNLVKDFHEDCIKIDSSLIGGDSFSTRGAGIAESDWRTEEDLKSIQIRILNTFELCKKNLCALTTEQKRRLPHSLIAQSQLQTHRESVIKILEDKFEQCKAQYENTQKIQTIRSKMVNPLKSSNLNIINENFREANSSSSLTSPSSTTTTTTNTAKRTASANQQNLLGSVKTLPNQNTADQMQEASSNHTLEESVFTDSEFQTLQMESDELYDKLYSDNERAMQIRNRISELGKMQQIFSENVSIQDNTIGDIYEKATESSMNMDFGNEQLRSAMKHQSSMRFWVIFILLVLTFSLLFIDWFYQ